MFRITLNGTVLTDEPDGLEDFATQFLRDETVKGLFVRYPISLTFRGDGYEILRRLFDTDYCSETTIKIEKACDGGYRELTTGLIFLRTITLNRSRCSAEVDVQEDSYSARIFNNLSTKVNLASTESKNGVSITPVPLAGGMELWSPTCGGGSCTPTYDTGAGEAGFAHPGRRQYFDVMDVLKFLTEWMTDGEVTVQSDWYDNLFTTQRTGLILGKELRLANGAEKPEVSFEQVFINFLQKTDNLFMTVEGTTGNRVLRIEDRAFFQGSNPVFQLDSLDDVEETVKQDLLYSKVEFGSAEVFETDTPDFPILNLFGHQQEEFQIQGTCNTNTILDLQLEFITDHNLILEVLLNDDDGYDTDIFAIEYTQSVTPKRATVSNPLLTTPESLVYNERYFNNEIIERYDLQGAIAKYLPDGADNRFLAVVNAGIPLGPAEGTSEFPIVFQDDYNLGNDPSNNYGNGTPQGTPVTVANARYTAPTDGLYGFFSRIAYERNGLIGPDIDDTVTIVLQRYNSSNVLISEFTETTGTIWQAPADLGREKTNHTISLTFNTYMEATDYMIVQLRFVHDVGTSPITPSLQSYYTVENGSRFECVSATDGGGVYEPKDADFYEVLQYTFTRALEDDKMIDLLADPVKAIDINFDGSNNIRCYIEDVTINHTTQNTEWVLITNPSRR